MSGLSQSVADYLTTRRALGYRLERHERLLGQFVAYLSEQSQDTVTVEAAVAWATLPATASPRWWAERLSVVRGFATWLFAHDPRTEVPSPDLLPAKPQRAVPYLYSDQEVAALMAATATIHSGFRAATYRTLIGLLAVTGIRIGEAIQLDCPDLDVAGGLLTVREGKFGKSRQLPLHHTTVETLDGYLLLRGGSVTAHSPALFVSTVGTRLLYRGVCDTFRRLTRHVGLTERSPSCRPRIHDLRHSFAVGTLLDWYRTGVDVEARLPLLSTYLGHVDPANTYWYLSAAPELMALAGQRLEQHLGDHK